MYSGYGIVFDGAGSRSFGNEDARNVIIFSVDNSSSFHADSCKNNLLLLGEEDTFFNEGFDAPEKKLSINFGKANTKLWLSLHHNSDSSYLSLSGKQTFKFKANNRKVNFAAKFFLGSISNGFRATESREVSLKGNAYDFSVDYYANDKSDIL